MKSWRLLQNLETLGYLYTKELKILYEVFYTSSDCIPYIHALGDFEWRWLIRPCLFCTRKQNAYSARRVSRRPFQTLPWWMNMGGTSGLVTLEDILRKWLAIADRVWREEDLPYTKLQDGIHSLGRRDFPNDSSKLMPVEEDFFCWCGAGSRYARRCVSEIHQEIPSRGR